SAAASTRRIVHAYVRSSDKTQPAGHRRGDRSSWAAAAPPVRKLQLEIDRHRPSEMREAQRGERRSLAAVLDPGPRKRRIERVALVHVDRADLEVLRHPRGAV